MTQYSPINWKLIGDAVLFYQEKGYTYVEAPWIVPEEALRVTLPEWARPHSLENDGTLVGSAEQGLIHMMDTGELPLGNYVAAGPCFRYEKEFDALHQQYFFKVELMHLFDPSLRDPKVELNSCLIAAMEFFFSQIGEGAWRDVFSLENTPDGTDICLNGIEVGSYGIREYNGHTWVYGTGVAEPRFSQVLRRQATIC